MISLIISHIFLLGFHSPPSASTGCRLIPLSSLTRAYLFFTAAVLPAVICTYSHWLLLPLLLIQLRKVLPPSCCSCLMQKFYKNVISQGLHDCAVLSNDFGVF